MSNWPTATARELRKCSIIGIVIRANRELAPRVSRASTPTEVNERSIDQAVSRLRGKLGDDPRTPQLIGTVHGAGYQFGAALK